MQLLCFSGVIQVSHLRFQQLFWDEHNYSQLLQPLACFFLFIQHVNNTLTAYSLQIWLLFHCFKVDGQTPWPLNLRTQKNPWPDRGITEAVKVHENEENVHIEKRAGKYLNLTANKSEWWPLPRTQGVLHSSTFPVPIQISRAVNMSTLSVFSWSTPRSYSGKICF